MCPYTTLCVSKYYHYVSFYYSYMCVLILPYMCAHTTRERGGAGVDPYNIFFIFIFVLGNGGSWGGSVRHFQLFLWRGWWAPAPAEDAGVCVLCVCVPVCGRALVCPCVMQKLQVPVTALARHAQFVTALLPTTSLLLYCLNKPSIGATARDVMH